jgi:hypothetical protein
MRWTAFSEPIHLQRVTALMHMQLQAGALRAMGNGFLGRFRRGRHRVRLRRYVQSECNPDFDVTQQEGPLVEPLSSEPTGDFVIALAGVAGGQAGTTLSRVYRPPRESASMRSRCSGLSVAPQYAQPPQAARSAVHCSLVRSCTTRATPAPITVH